MLEERAETIAASVERDWTLSHSATALRSMLPLIGLPSSVELIRLNAKVRRHLAWCLVHQGRAFSALTEAVRATRLQKVAYRNSGDRADLVGLGEITLIASNACLLRREPSRASRWLDLHRDAHRESGERLNVEYFRQRGVAAFQLGDWAMARQSFGRVGDAATDAEAPLWLHHARDRHLSLLSSPDWELAASALQGIRSLCAPDALPIVTATQWTIAAGIASDSPQANYWAAEMLSTQQQMVGRFAHQQTVAWLMGRTERLQLPNVLRHQWVSRILYANDSANR